MSPSNFSNGGHLSGSLALWVAVSLVGLWLGAVGSSAGGKFSFPMHHRFSDPVKRMLPASLDMPKKGTVDYYRAMVHRDRAIHPGRRLSSEGGDRSHLTFASGNDTLRIASLGYLLYASIMVGTPSLSFLVALDTGSDWFWLPCDCLSCVRGLKTPDGEEILFNIYSPNASSTASVIPCNSPSCSSNPRCPDARWQCYYQVFYGSNNSTSSTGVLVKDVLRLITDDDQGKAVDAEITFGCGRIQTGFLLGGAAPNGLFGLGMTNISVPSILAGEGLISNSFSMCFSPDSVGRISFGDKGSPDQGETPFNLGHSQPFYNISITGANVGGTTHDLQFTAIFDSGTSITQLSDPAYTLISDSFNSHAKDKRTPRDPSIPFEYCYEPSPNRSSLEIPALNLMMKGGDVFSINKPVAYITIDEFTLIYCLAMVRDSGMNIIGQNFMTGYRVVFDRERMVLGWKESDCYSADDTSLPPAPAPNAGAASGPTGNSLKDSSSLSPSSGSWYPSPSIYVLAIVLCPILAVF